jgi:hypothetical protein
LIFGTIGIKCTQLSKFTLQGEGGKCSTKANTSSFGNKRKGSGDYTMTSLIPVYLHRSSEIEKSSGS